MCIIDFPHVLTGNVQKLEDYTALLPIAPRLQHFSSSDTSHWAQVRHNLHEKQPGLNDALTIRVP